jgi:GT2 family glycosyltransferase
MTIRVSVVIPTCRRPELLGRCLEALLGQTLPAAEFEVIVVDDGDCARTRQIVAAVSGARIRPDGPRIRLLQALATQGPAAARNLGWRHAQGEVIAFTDDDTVPVRDWLAEGLKALRPTLAAVAGRVVVPTPARATDFERMTKGLEDAEFVTANAFVRRAALEAVGGFDERFLRAWREDSDLQFRLIRSGRAIGWAPMAVVEHPVREAPWGISLRLQRNVFFDALLYKKHPQLYRLKLRPRPPWAYFVIVLAHGLALAATLAGGMVVAVGAWCVALGLSLRLAIQRLKGASLAPSHVLEMLTTSLLIPFLSVYWRLAGAWHFKVRFI